MKKNNTINFPKIDLRKLDKKRKRNFKQKLEFIDMYADWLRKTALKENVE